MNHPMRRLTVDNATYVIYVLCEPDTMVPRYVGRTTAHGFGRRYHEHCSAKRCNPELRQWVEELRESGRKPLMIPIHTTSDKQTAEMAEHFTIKDFRNVSGVDLLNMNDGSGGRW